MSRSDRSDRSTPSGQQPDPVEAYLAAYVDAVDRGEEPPSLDHLDAETRAEAAEFLTLLAGEVGDVDQADEPDAGGDLAGDRQGSGPDPADPAGVSGRRRTDREDADGTGSGRAGTGPVDVVETATTGADAHEAAGGTSATRTGEGAQAGVLRSGAPAGMRPRAESRFALAHGFVRPAPDVVVVGRAVRQAREESGLAVADVALDMRRRGAAIEVEQLASLEGDDRAASRLPPREARLLAAVLGQPLAAVEAKAEPWPADPGALDEIRQAGVDAVVLGEDVVVRTVRGDHLGVLRCPGDADLLDSRTYREAAATLLTGPWSYLAGALLVAGEAPHLALAVDALDCVTRWHAPTGLLGFSRLAEPEPLPDAVASYDRTYTVRWSDPTPLDGVDGAGGVGPVAGDVRDPGGPVAGDVRDPHSAAARAGDIASRARTIADRLGSEARRSRQPGKRPGYEAAARWLGSFEARDLTALLDELADLPADIARAWLDEQVAGEVVVT